MTFFEQDSLLILLTPILVTVQKVEYKDFSGQVIDHATRLGYFGLERELR